METVGAFSPLDIRHYVHSFLWMEAFDIRGEIREEILQFSLSSNVCSKT